MKPLRGVEFITINAYYLGINTAAGVITPLLLPYLVALSVPDAQKNTHLATVRVASLAAAMLAQPLAGTLSDRSTHRWGRRRPFILWGTVFNLLFLLLLGSVPRFKDLPLSTSLGTVSSVSAAFGVLLVGVILLQASTNAAQGALQGLIPDLVPPEQRGRASGVKAGFELLPILVVILVGPLVDAGRIWLTVGILMAGYVITMLVTVTTVHEIPRPEPPTTPLGERLLRLLALTFIFVGATQLAVWGVNYTRNALTLSGIAVSVQIPIIGLAGLGGMAGAILLGAYMGARVAIGRQASEQTSFIWWVINRLLFLTAVGSIQGFALFYLRDVLGVAQAATMTSRLLAVVAVFLLPSALAGGYLSDRFGRKRLVSLAGWLGSAGTLLLLLAPNTWLVFASGGVIGLAAGNFMAANWALGTDLAPAGEAARYLGISNMAGAGAGIVGAGIGGPLVDFFNHLQPGLGYLVIFAVYGSLFGFSSLALHMVKHPEKAGS